MATDVLPKLPTPASVRRCLFGVPPDRNDDFRQARREMDVKAARRFQERWNINVLEDTVTEGEGNIRWVKSSSSDGDIPRFYSKGYAHKCRRRAVRPCIGKALRFESTEDRSSCGDESEGRSPSPLPCFVDASIVDVFIGLRLPSQHLTSLPDLVTPTPGFSLPCTPRSTSSTPRSTQSTPDSLASDTSSVEMSDVSTSSTSPSPLRSRSPSRRTSQSRLTDHWPIRKRARSASTSLSLAKRMRLL